MEKLFVSTNFLDVAILRLNMRGHPLPRSWELRPCASAQKGTDDVVVLGYARCLHMLLEAKCASLHVFAILRKNLDWCKPLMSIMVVVLLTLLIFNIAHDVCLYLQVPILPPAADGAPDRHVRQGDAAVDSRVWRG